MVKTNKTIKIKLFSLLIAATLLGSLLTVPVSAKLTAVPNKKAFISVKGDNKKGVHADITTFEKNFSLTVAQKEYSIKKINKTVAIVTDPEMSDLEKYYRLALWENDHATYDFNFWDGGYDFSYYRHQWDAYGVLTDTSVCAGIAICYSNLCHAADLPCKFVRTYPDVLDHTINYIPDINGNAYYVDVTEGAFIMSKDCDYSFEESAGIDTKFAYIEKLCTDQTFDYEVKYGESEDAMKFIKATNIKDWMPYSRWFKEYALHEGTTKKFLGTYVEKGSGTPGVHYASYHDYPKQFSAAEKPGIWFLEDFYKDPEEIKSKILNKQIDNQLINVKSLRDSYDCKNSSELKAEILSDASVEFFPSLQNGEIVANEIELETGKDFTLSCKSFDKAKGQAVMVITGTGDYKGTSQFTVNLKSDAVKKADNPMKLKGKIAAVSYKKLRKKSQIIKGAKLIKIRNAKGKLVYKYVTAKKGKKNVKKYFKVSAKTGKIKVRKGLKKGTYRVKVKIRAMGDNAYKASPWKSVVFKVKVK